MASGIEQDSGIGRSATLMLFMVSLLCIALIGGAGFVKFQVDRTTYNLVAASTEIKPADPQNTEEQKLVEQKNLDNQHKRLTAEKDLHDWSLALTFISWVSLIGVAGMIIAIYLILQRRQSPALRALGQSITNLSRGDMQTPIWGIERHDAIGDLARAVDQTRFHFSQLPDVTMLSDQGPVRFKFEGGARTLFDAMMQQLTSQASRVGEEAANLAASAKSQHKILTELPLRLNGALDHLQRFDKNNTQLIQRATQSLASASGQLEHLVPFMQSRAQNMAEVTQIAGTQVANTIKDLVEAGEGLRITTSRSNKSVEDLSSSTKELGERIFAALNILQASGKVLNETTESTQSRMKELVDTLGNGETKLSTIVDRVEQRLEATAKAEESLLALTEKTESSSDQMDHVIQTMVEHQDRLNGQIASATERLDQIIGSFTEAQDSMGGALQNIKQNGDLLNGLFSDLKNSNEQVLGKLSRTSETSHEVVQHLAECSEKLLNQLQDHLTKQTEAAEAHISTMAHQNEALSQQAASATEALTQSVGTMQGAQEKLGAIHDRFADMVRDLGGTLERQVTDSFSRAEEISKQNLEKLSSLTQSVDQALQRLSVLSQLTNTLGTVAGELGQLIPSLGSGMPPSHLPVLEAPSINVAEIANKLADELSGHFEALITQIKPPVATPVVVDGAQIDMSEISDKMFAEFEEKWKSSVNQIDSVRDDLSELMEHQKDHLDMRLKVLDKQIKSLAAQKLEPSQIALLQEIVDALAVMNEHLTQNGLPLVTAPLDEQSPFMDNALSS